MGKIDYKPYKVKTLIEELLYCDQEADVYLPFWNGYTDTYSLADHIFEETYDTISNDFFGTPGKMDARLFRKDGPEKIVYIGTYLDRHIKNEEIDIDSDPNVQIELINGEDGDHDLFWKQNGFMQLSDFLWEYRSTKKDEEDKYKPTQGYFRIQYNNLTKTLDVVHTIYGEHRYEYRGDCIGLYDFYDIMKACKINKTFWS